MGTETQTKRTGRKPSENRQRRNAQGEKSIFKIRNWKQYNEALVRRYDITFWLSDAILSRWKHDNENQGQGRPFTYSDLAVETLLTMRELFQLPYRGTEGFGKWVFSVMQWDLAVSGYTALCKRAKQLDINLLIKQKKGKIDILVDSTGLKVYGESEWRISRVGCRPPLDVRTHGKSKRRTWRKLHLGVNAETQEIEAEVLTGNDCHDSQAVSPLLKRTRHKIRRFYGDGACDPWDVRGELAKRNAKQIIPSRKDAKIKRHGNSKEPRLERDDAIRGIRRFGRKGWKKRIGDHRRSLAETAMFRMKTIFGDRLKNRLPENQKTEARIRCKILNHFTHLGLPRYS